MKTRTAALLPLLLALVAFGCKKKDERTENAKKVTASSTDDATQSIDDTDYRFQIRWPGDGWKLLREKDARRLLPDAVAGAIYKSNGYGAVVVESAPGVELEPFARLINDNMLLEDKQVEQFEKIQFKGRDAYKMVVTGKANGVSFRYAEIVFLHQGYGYQLIGWGMIDQVPENVSTFDPFFDAFSITEGEIKARVAEAVVTDARGVGWHLKSGMFESAVTRLKVEPANGWRVAVGAELEQMSADAEVGITRTGPEIYAVFITERAPSERERKAYRDKLHDDMRINLGLEELPDKWTGSFGGKQTEFTRFKTSNKPVFEYLYNVHYDGDRLVQVVVWFLQGEADNALAQVQSGFDTVSFMDAGAAAKLATELRSERDPQNSIGGGFALRNGLYRDYTSQWTWNMPRDAFWRVYAGEEARQVRPDLTLYVTEPSLGLYGLFLDDTAEGYTPDTYHEAVLQTMDGEKKAIAPRTLGPAQVRTSLVDLRDTGGTTRYHLSTITHADHAVQIIFWGLPEDIDANAKAIDAALEGFRFAEERMEPVVASGRDYHDERMGFAVRLPNESWRFTDMTPAAVKDVGSFVFWQYGSRMIGVVAVHALENADDPDWFLDFLEQLARDQLGNMANVAPTRKETTLAGVPARQLTWTSGMQRLDAYLIVREKTIYALMTAGSSDGSGALMDLLSGFRLVD